MIIENDRRAAVLQRRLERLRREFDASFAEPLTEVDSGIGSLLCFTAGGARFAIPMLGLQSVTRCAAITAVPARSPALLGLTVVRAQIVPVYSLVHLTGIGDMVGACHWLALLRGAIPIALAVDALEGYAVDTALESTTGDASGLVSGIVRHGTELFAALRAAELYERITAAASQHGKDSK